MTDNDNFLDCFIIGSLVSINSACATFSKTYQNDIIYEPIPRLFSNSKKSLDDLRVLMQVLELDIKSIIDNNEKF